MLPTHLTISRGSSRLVEIRSPSTASHFSEISFSPEISLRSPSRLPMAPGVVLRVGGRRGSAGALEWVGETQTGTQQPEPRAGREQRRRGGSLLPGETGTTSQGGVIGMSTAKVFAVGPRLPSPSSASSCARNPGATNDRTRSLKEGVHRAGSGTRDARPAR